MLEPVRRQLRYAVWRLAEPPAFLPPLVVLSLKVALASGLAWALGQAFHFPRPFDAVLAVIILMQGHAYGSLLNALEFLLGVAAGLILGILADRLLGISAPVLAAVMFVCLLMGGWLKVSSQGFNNQIAVSALLVLASGSTTNVARLWQTVIGGAVGVAVAALIWPPNPVRGLRQESRENSLRLKSDLRRSLELAGGSGDAEANRRRVRVNSERADGAVAAVTPAEDALRWNPWHAGRIHDLSRLEDRLRLISYLYRTVRALARQAAKAPGPDREQREDWERARPYLLEAGERVVEGIDRRLAGRDVHEPVERAHEAVGRFAVEARGEPNSIALAAALDDLVSDLEGWRPPHQVNPERQFVARVMRRLGRREPRELPLVVQGELEFEEERRESRLRSLSATLSRRAAAPPLTDIMEAAGVAGWREAGVQDIPIAQIKGSESLSADFDASFLPRRRRLQEHWVQIYTQMEQGAELQPIEVYQLGDSYFVKDGQVRVSVARHLGWEKIQARVVEVTTRAPVGPDVKPEELLRAAEYASFLERTQLDRTRPEARLACSQLGRYDVIFEHILGHRYFLAVGRGQEVSIPEAAASWYDSVYRPLMDVVKANDIEKRLPGWTETDVYLAMTRLWLDLDAEGQPAGPEGAARALLANPGAAARAAPGRRRRRHRRKPGRVPRVPEEPLKPEVSPPPQ